MIQLKYFISILFFILSHFLVAQDKIIEGVVTDSQNIILEYANIIAKPNNPNLNISFSISDQKGRYKLQLLNNETYIIEVRYLGYQPINFVLDASSQISQKNFILKPAKNELQEIVIISDLPISYKNDTLIYQTDVFVNGSERKLKEVLKKLPGVEVDRKGNITVHGKKVDKILIEGETFFSGGTKLAVENIPADAVNTVEVIDNYNEVEFLSEVSGSEELAMNITLKEDKKNFVFGDINVGGGIKNRNLIHPNLFYYSPKSNFNFIGDLNNVGEKTFTINDFVSFNGGMGKLISNPTSFFKHSTEEFFPFLENQDDKKNINRFIGLRLKKRINTKLNTGGYFIFSNTNTVQSEIRENQYLNDSLPTFETRTLDDNLKTNLGILKFSLDYIPKRNMDVSYNLSLKKLINHFDNKYLSTTIENQSYINTQQNLNNSTLQQNFEFHQKKSKKYSSSFVLNHFYKNENGEKSWLTNSEIISFLLPLQDSIPYHVFQDKKVNRHQIDGLWKHYFILNRKNHIYFSVGNNIYHQKYFTNETQKIANGNIIDFQNEGFSNDLDFQLNNFFVNLSYKNRRGISTTKLELAPHFYFWKIKQNNTLTKNKIVLIPKWKTEFKFSKAEKLEVNYQVTTNFADVSAFSNRLYLRDFNAVFIGNSQLENEFFHQSSLHYKKSSWFSNYDFNTSLAYIHKAKRIRNENIMLGIFQITSPSLVSTPLEEWNWKANFRKGIKKIDVKLKSKIRFSKYDQLINFQEFKTKQTNLSNGISLETNFKKYPNIEIGIDHTFQKFHLGENTSIFKRSEPFVFIDYLFFKCFTFKFDYQGTFFKNDFGSSSRYGIANTSLFFQKEDAPFGFEIKVNNLFNTKIKRQATFTQSIIADISTSVLPRTILFSLTYKL